jgi:hypothetical protein
MLASAAELDPKTPTHLGARLGNNRLFLREIFSILLWIRTLPTYDWIASAWCAVRQNQVSLISQDKPKYEALSYTSGSQTQVNFPILLNENWLPLSPDLFAAILHLRPELVERLL